MGDAGHLQELSASKLTPPAIDVVDTVYHEARHAEQRFRIAQLRAMQLRRASGPGEDERLARAISSEIKMALRIARRAVATPLEAGGMNALIAQGWYDSTYGSGKAHRRWGHAELERKDAALASASEECKRHPTPENKEALKRAERRRETAFQAYLNLPEEHDAWTTGTMARSGVTRGTPAAPFPREPAHSN